MRKVLVVASMLALAALGTSAAANAPPVVRVEVAPLSVYELKITQGAAEELAGPIGGALLGIVAGSSNRSSPGGAANWYRKHAPARASPLIA